jgi:hypothetical protein
MGISIKQLDETSAYLILGHFDRVSSLSWLALILSMSSDWELRSILVIRILSDSVFAYEHPLE